MLRGSSENPFSDKKTSSWALLDLVDHIIRHLIYFELTPQKKDRKSSKSKYLVDYIIQIGKPKEYEENLLLKKNLWQKKVYSKGQKTNEAFSI